MRNIFLVISGVFPHESLRRPSTGNCAASYMLVQQKEKNVEYNGKIVTLLQNNNYFCRKERDSFM